MSHGCRNRLGILQRGTPLRGMFHLIEESLAERLWPWRFSNEKEDSSVYHRYMIFAGDLVKVVSADAAPSV